MQNLSVSDAGGATAGDGEGKLMFDRAAARR